MALLKLASHLRYISKHHLRRFQNRDFHNGHLLYKRVMDYSTELSQIDHEDFGKLTTMYKFPFMIHSQFFCNTKYYLALIYVPLWIMEGAGYALGELSTNDLILINLAQALFFAKSLFFNKWCTHLIGFMYLTEDENLVVSYINFRGRRIDEKFAKDELVLETNKFKILDKLYIYLHCKATGRRFKLNLKFSEMNEFAMIDCFGSLPNSAF